MTSTVHIAKNVYGGDGIGRLGDGRVVFVPGAWAGESVRAEIVEERRHFVRARLVEVAEPSPARRDGGAFAGVPGCVYANLSYAAECDAKEGQLAEFLERARLGARPVRGAVARTGADGEVAGYRNKVTYHFGRRRGAWAIGYRAEPSHEVVDMAADPLAVRPIGDRLPEIRRAVLSLLTTGPEAVRRGIAAKGGVTVRWSARTGVRWWTGDAPRDLAFQETTCGRVFEVPAGGFYQVNPAIGEELVRYVAAEYAKEGGDVLDLYCGVGVFGLCCSPARLVGVESGREAVEFARRNAAAQGVAAKFVAGQAGRTLRQVRTGPATTVIVDPPRGGMEPNVTAFLAKSGAPRIVYVSCDPATLARDLRTLAQGYAVESVRWFDMFPRTARFETVAVLRRKTAAGRAG